MSSSAKPIVTDTYDFPTLIKRGCVYVDKTAFLLRMISGIGVNYDPRKTGVGVVSEVVNPSDEVVNSVDEVVNEVVKSHPGLRKPELVPLVGKSRATVERVLSSLISSGRIEFRGAPKNGGYYGR